MSDSTRSSLSSRSARSRQTSSKLSTISSSSRSVAPRSYPRGLRASLTCRISTGVSAISPPPFSIQSVEDRLDQPLEEDEAEDRDDRRQVQGAEGRQDATEQTQIGLADVVEEALNPVQPRRIGKPNPGRDDVREDQEDVDRDEDVHEVPDRRDCVREHGQAAHAAEFGPQRGLPLKGLSLVEEAAALEESRALLGGDLDVSRREQEDLVGDALHSAAKRVGEPAREVDQPLGELSVGALEVEDDRRPLLELVRDLLGIVETARDDQMDAHRWVAGCGLDRAGPGRPHDGSPGAGSGFGLRPVLELAPSSRSEEHTSELQSHHDLVCRLLLEKKNRHQQCPLQTHITNKTKTTK